MAAAGGASESAPHFIRQLHNRAVDGDRSGRRAYGRLPSCWERMALHGVLRAHRGCVNHVEWCAEAPHLLASGSDDTHLCLWDAPRERLLTNWATGHSANIFGIAFMPGGNGEAVATCAGDGEVRLHDLRREPGAACRVFDHHTDRVKKLLTLPSDPHTLLSCSEDATVQRVDLRTRRAHALAALQRRGEALDVYSMDSPRHKPWLLAVGAADDRLRVYDMRMGGSAARGGTCKCVHVFTPADYPAAAEGFSTEGVTGVAFTHDGSAVVGNYMMSDVFMFSLPSQSAQRLDRRAPLGGGGDDVASPARRGRRDASGADGGGGGDRGTPPSGAPQPPATGRMHISELVAQLEEGRVRVSRHRQASVVSSLLHRAEQLHEEGNSGEAVRYARAALRVAPDNGRAHYQVALCLEDQGDVAGALAGVQSALLTSWSQQLDDMAARLQLVLLPRQQQQPPPGPLRAAEADPTCDAPSPLPAHGLATGAASLPGAPDPRRGEGGAFVLGATPSDAEQLTPPPLQPRARTRGPPHPSVRRASPSPEHDTGSSTSGVSDSQGVSSEDGTPDGAALLAFQADAQGEDEEEEGEEEEEEEEEDDESVAIESGSEILSLDSLDSRQLLEAERQYSWGGEMESQTGSDCSDDAASGVAGQSARAEEKQLGRPAQCLWPEDDPGPSGARPDLLRRWVEGGCRPVLVGQERDIRHGRPPWDVRFRGAYHQLTIKGVAFAGPDQQLVMAGSDGGRLLMWERDTGRLLAAPKGDALIVNLVACHPHQPLLASCGIDSTVKLWSPCRRLPGLSLWQRDDVRRDLCNR